MVKIFHSIEHFLFAVLCAGYDVGIYIDIKFMRIQLSIKLNISFLRSFGERAEFDPVCVCYQLLQRATDCALELQYTLSKYSFYLNILGNLMLYV